MKNSDRVRMDYPDGTIHHIEFSRFYPIKIGNVDCYVAVYFDYTLNSTMITLITYIDGIWHKIPLNSEGYSYLNDYIEKNQSKYLDASDYDLGDRIRLAYAMDLIPPSNDPNDKRNKKPLFKVNYYVPINSNGVTNVKNTIYRSNSVTTEINKNQTYSYEKAFNNNKISSSISRGVEDYFINRNGVKQYDFLVEIRNGDSATKEIVTKDGKRMTIVAHMVPGLFECSAYYSDFVDYDDYTDAMLSDNIKINANTNEYKDLHDYDKVWKNGGNKELEMNFDIVNNNTIKM